MSQYTPDHSPTRYLAKATKLNETRSVKAPAIKIVRTPLPKRDDLPVAVPVVFTEDPYSPLPGAVSPTDSRPPPACR